MKAGERGTYGPWQIQKHASARFTHSADSGRYRSFGGRGLRSDGSPVVITADNPVLELGPVFAWPQ